MAHIAKATAAQVNANFYSTLSKNQWQEPFLPLRQTYLHDISESVYEISGQILYTAYELMQFWIRYASIVYAKQPEGIEKTFNGKKRLPLEGLWGRHYEWCFIPLSDSRKHRVSSEAMTLWHSPYQTIPTSSKKKTPTFTTIPAQKGHPPSSPHVMPLTPRRLVPRDDPSRGHSREECKTRPLTAAQRSRQRTLSRERTESWGHHLRIRAVPVALSYSRARARAWHCGRGCVFACVYASVGAPLGNLHPRAAAGFLFFPRFSDGACGCWGGIGRCGLFACVWLVGRRCPGVLVILR